MENKIRNIRDYVERHKNIFLERHSAKLPLRWRIYQLLFYFWMKYVKITKRDFSKPKSEFEKAIRTFPICGNVLDIGGGSGWMSEYWQRSGDEKYYVLDPILRKAIFKQKSYLESNLFFVQGQAEKINFKNSVFNCVIIAASLDHFSNPDKGLQEAARVLKKCGNLIISNQISYSGRSKIGHQRNFSLQELQKLIEKYFEINRLSFNQNKKVVYIWATKI